MSLDRPEAPVRKAVDAAVAWFRKSAIHGQSYTRGPEAHLVPNAEAPLLWSRYYAIDTGRPVFGDRDQSIHDTVEEISRERRAGYSWYGAAPQAVLDRYDAWSSGVARTSGPR
jgi:PelA/Pel-15E family pectate lyase